MTSETNPFAFDPEPDRRTPALSSYNSDPLSGGLENLYLFTNPVGLARITKGLLVLYAAVLMGNLVLMFLQLDLLQDALTGNVGPGFQQRAETNDRRIALCAGLQILMLLATAVASLKLLYRLRANVDWLGATGLENSPGWSIGWFFVPVVHLWKPLAATTDTWNASADPDGDWDGRTPPVLNLWWALWIVSMVGDRVVHFMMSGAMSTIEELMNATWAAIATLLIDLVLTLVYGYMLASLTSIQMNTYYRLRATGSNVQNPTAAAQPSV